MTVVLFVLPCLNHDIIKVQELRGSINIILEEILHDMLVSVLSISSTFSAIKLDNPVKLC